MADLKISGATINPAPVGSDSFATNKAGVDFQTTLTQVKSFSAGGPVDISALLGGVDSQMLVRVAGIWTSSPALRFDTLDLSIDGHITTRVSGGGELRNVSSGFTVPTLIPRNNRIANGWGSDPGSDNMGLVLQNDAIFNWLHTGAADNSVKRFFFPVNVTASTTQAQGNGTLNGNEYTVIDVVANVDDVNTLPLAATGLIMKIVNSGANRAQLFPGVGDNFANEATNASIKIEVGEAIIIYALNPTEWAFLARVPATGAAALPTFQLSADQFDNPNNADWTVNALAPAVADTNNNGLTVRLFDDTTEEGIGFEFEVPSTATNIVFDFRSRAETAPGAVRTVGLKLYNRGIPDDAAVEAWSAGEVLADIDIPTNEFFQEDSETISLATLGITAGEFTQFELTRIDPVAGTELVGDWALKHIKVSFT